MGYRGRKILLLLGLLLAKPVAAEVSPALSANAQLSQGGQQWQLSAQVGIDAQGFVTLSGRRAFPLGIYNNLLGDEHLQRIAAAGFNTVLNYNYGARKDPLILFAQARKHDLWVIYSLKDFYAGTRFAPPNVDSYPALTQWYVEQLKLQPNLLAWYINDELGPEYLPEIERQHQQIKLLDPNHPTFQVLDRINSLDAYLNSSDIIASDPYPVGKDPDLTRTLRYTERTMAATHGIKGGWVVIQIMDHAAYNPQRLPHLPTEQEIRSQAWSALIGGARGLLFYSYTDLFYLQKRGQFSLREFERNWQGIAAVSQEIAHFSPYLLSGQSELLQGDNPALFARMFMGDRRALVLVTNPFYQAKTSTFPLPKGWGWQGARQFTVTLDAVGSQVLWLERQ